MPGFTHRRFSPLARTGVSAAAASLALLLPGAAQAQVTANIIAGTSTNIAGITDERDAFRATIGGGSVSSGGPGLFGGVRREINWDGVPDGFSDPNNLPGNFFNVNSPRGAVFSTPGSGFRVSANAGGAAPVEFGGINPTYPTTFEEFSPQKLFTSIGSNIMDVNFFAPGTNNPGTVSAFGVIFSDVDLANTTSLQFFDINNVLITTAANPTGVFFAPALVGSETFSFLGVQFTNGPGGTPASIANRVRITSGNTALGPNATDQNGDNVDVVTMDDFIYSEATAALEPGTLLLALGALPAAFGVLRRRKR